MTGLDGAAPEVAVMAEQCTGRGLRGVVCAAAPLAALAGAEVLRAGGNAYDAAVTMALAEGVLLPPKCGLGGDAVALVLDPGADAPEAMLAIGGAPRGLAQVALSGAWRDVGPTSVGPPGAPAGYLALAARGRLPLARLATPAVELARDGFPWARVCTDLARQSVDLLREMHPEGTVYLPGGRPIAPGAAVRLPGLARAIEELVELGEGFLAGPVGTAIVQAVERRGGVLTGADLREVRARWVTPAEGVLAGRRAWATPAPTHGPALLDAVAGLEPDDDPGAVYRRVAEAVAASVEGLADPGGTSLVSAVDATGAVVVLMHSNSYPRFGSGIVVPEYDLVLANRAGRGFTPVPGHPNFPEPGRRPATTLHVWAVAGEDGRPRLMGATPGGVNQLPWNAQLLAQVAAGVDQPGLLVTSPRWEWLPADGGVRAEGGFTDGELEGLRAAAPRVLTASRWAGKSAQQVVRVSRPGEVAEGAADPRTVGQALGV